MCGILFHHDMSIRIADREHIIHSLKAQHVDTKCRANVCGDSEIHNEALHHLYNNLKMQIIHKVLKTSLQNITGPPYFLVSVKKPVQVYIRYVDASAFLSPSWFHLLWNLHSFDVFGKFVVWSGRCPQLRHQDISIALFSYSTEIHVEKCNSCILKKSPNSSHYKKLEEVLNRIPNLRQLRIGYPYPLSEYMEWKKFIQLVTFPNYT